MYTILLFLRFQYRQPDSYNNRLPAVRLSSELYNKQSIKKTDIFSHCHYEALTLQANFFGMKKAVIFDMDGVLVDNRDIHIEAFEVLCNKHGLNFDREKILRSFGQLNEQIFEALLGKGALSPEKIEEYGIEKEEICREIFAKKIKPTNGLTELLKGLKRRGVKIAVGSSGPLKNVQFVLDRCGIAEYFDAIANGDMVSKGKPDPEVFLLAAKLLGEEPEDCLVFEDAFVGIEAARRAGMNVVALATTFPKEILSGYDMVISDFTEIDESIVDKF